MKIIPFFEIDGQRYEIKRTRYLLAEYDKLSKESELSNDDKTNAIKAQNLIADVQKYAQKTQELEEKYFETLDDEDERKYLKMKSLRDKALEDLARFEAETGSTTRLQEEGLKLLEKIAIIALAEQYFDMNVVFAKQLWEKFVASLGSKEQLQEWLSYMSEYLFNEEQEVEENSFLSQMRKKAEERANNRRNIKKK